MPVLLSHSFSERDSDRWAWRRNVSEKRAQKSLPYLVFSIRETNMPVLFSILASITSAVRKGACPI